MNDLVTWLRAQLDEDIEMDASAAGHIARHDPARVLAEVEAKRRILDDYEMIFAQAAENSAKFVAMTSASGQVDQAEYTMVKTHGWTIGGRVEALRAAVQCLALPYADRPGYREEWRP